MHRSNGRAVVALGVALACALGAASEALAQQQQQPVRPPVRVRVQPERLPPNAVRQCKFWLAQENRPSGAVIVPREVCRWERG
jgi:hypothetical protein